MALWGQGDERWKVKEMGEEGTNVKGWHWVTTIATGVFKAKIQEQMDMSAFPPGCAVNGLEMKQLDPDNTEVEVQYSKGRNKCFVSYDDLRISVSLKLDDGSAVCKVQLDGDISTEKNRKYEGWINRKMTVIAGDDVDDQLSLLGKQTIELLAKCCKNAVEETQCHYLGISRDMLHTAQAAQAAAKGKATQVEPDFDQRASTPVATRAPSKLCEPAPKKASPTVQKGSTEPVKRKLLEGMARWLHCNSVRRKKPNEHAETVTVASLQNKISDTTPTAALNASGLVDAAALDVTALLKILQAIDRHKHKTKATPTADQKLVLLAIKNLGQAHPNAPTNAVPRSQLKTLLESKYWLERLPNKVFGVLFMPPRGCWGAPEAKAFSKLIAFYEHMQKRSLVPFEVIHVPAIGEGAKGAREEVGDKVAWCSVEDSVALASLWSDDKFDAKNKMSDTNLPYLVLCDGAGKVICVDAADKILKTNASTAIKGFPWAVDESVSPLQIAAVMAVGALVLAGLPNPNPNANPNPSPIMVSSCKHAVTH